MRKHTRKAMWSRLLAWLALPPLVAAAGCAVRPATMQAEAASVVLMRYRLSDDFTAVEGRPHCGGVAVAPRTILTAAHCLRGGVGDAVDVVTRPQWFATSHGRTVARIAWIDHGRDVAGLSVASDLPAVAPMRAAVEGDSPVALVRRFAVTQGVASPYVGRLSTSVRHGDSGSPVVGADGAVIGLVSRCDSRGAVCRTDAAAGGFYAPVAP